MVSPFEQLVQLMARLRAPGGCPWDREQTHESILPKLIEESYELISAVESENNDHVREELGDLLLHIVFHSQIAKDEGAFQIDDVIRTLSEKLVRRHPHVFGDVTVKDSREVIKNWDEIKAAEKEKKPDEGLFDSVPRSFPALLEANKLNKKAAKVGFDWKKTDDVLAKIDEEIGEFREELRTKNGVGLEHEMGDLLLALANLCRFIDVQPEEALRKANGRFRRRFALMEKKIEAAGKKMENLSPQEWDRYWNQAKKEGE